jgi:hypothetical protein
MKVEVRNLDSRDYIEIYRDNEIRIPANGHILMERSDAVRFLGQATEMKKDGQGRPLNPKRLKIYDDPEKHAEHRQQPVKYDAPGGKQFRTEQGYNSYMEQLAAEAENNGVPDDNRPRKRKRAAG